MAIRWTEFPEKVELFGDLFSILESLDRDTRLRAIVASTKPSAIVRAEM